MPVERVGKFLEFQDLGITPSLGIESKNLSECIAEVEHRNWRGVFGCPSFGFAEQDLDFLQKLPGIIQVWFWDIDLKSIDGLYALKDLKYFGIHQKRPGIRFSSFPLIETLVWEPRPKDTGIESLDRLRDLYLWRWQPKHKSYAGLELPNSIERLELNWCNPASFDQISNLPNLKELKIFYSRGLTSISSIFNKAPKLESLVIANCPNLLLEQEMKRLSELKKVRINNKVIVG